MPATPPSTPPSTPPALSSATRATILATPPPPAPLPLPSATPPTSPQLAQQAARHEEHNLHIMGSPEQRRTPTMPSASTASVTFGGRTYHHLPANLAAQLAALPSIPTRPSRQSTSLAEPPQILTSAQLAATHASLSSLYPQPNIRQPTFVSLNCLFLCAYTK
jgi:hypothetical protein